MSGEVTQGGFSPLGVASGKVRESAGGFGIPVVGQGSDVRPIEFAFIAKDKKFPGFTVHPEPQQALLTERAVTRVDGGGRVGAAHVYWG